MELDFDRVWREQRVSEVLNEALVRSADGVVSRIVDPPAGSKNVTEWAKQQACWARVEKVKIKWPDDLESVLVSRAKGKDLAKEAKKEQKVDNGIEAQTKVLEAGVAAWKDVEAWGRERGLISEKESSIFKICASAPKKVPSPKQSVVALETVRRLHDEGCQLLKDL